MAVSKEKLLDMYETMLKIRYFEEKVDELFKKRLIMGTTHLYVGEEAVAAGACAAIRPDDYILSTHRGHGHCIAKGGDLNKMMAELHGKATGYCKGKGGSLHIADVESGNLGANGIVGGGIPIAPGAGLSAKMRGTDQVTLCFFGDGAVNQGAFHESINLASVWKLPVVYILENNLYGMSTAVSKASNVEDLAVRAQGYGIEGVIVDGNDVEAVYEAVSKAVEKARKGGGPTLIECKTYRQKGHSKSDQRKYRTREEEREWLKRDPIPRAKKRLIEMGVPEEELDELEQQVKQKIEAAVEYANESPYPDVEELTKDVYA